MIGGFAPSCEAKSASTSGAPSPSHSEQAACAFRGYPASAARMVGGFAPSCEAKSASTSGAPSPSHSERAACAFKVASLIQIVLLVLRSCVLLGGLLVLVLRREFGRFRISVLRRGSERHGQLVDHKLVSLRFRRAG
ncbi:hypothetical protein BWGOE3_52970 [Bacillus mycoides]|nr:hypothetical protein BWGOE3_52970 [Bacillus mycoides]OFD55695.1 hypothetical protein BWGOE6_53180 [Bacillus mycoides]